MKSAQYVIVALCLITACLMLATRFAPESYNAFLWGGAVLCAFSALGIGINELYIKRSH